MTEVPNAEQIDHISPESDPSDKLIKSELKDNLKKEWNDFFDKLSEEDKIIIGMRLGLAGQDPMTLKELGDKFGKDKERIRQIQTKILSQFREKIQRVMRISGNEEPVPSMSGERELERVREILS